jgi:hypothetical protein
MIDIKSATAHAYRIPIIQYIFDNMKNKGINNIICLDSDKKALILLFQIDWKKIHAGICIQYQKQNNRYILNAKHANSIYFSFHAPKIQIICSGIVWNNVNANTPIKLHDMITNLRASFTLLNFLAQ